MTQTTEKDTDRNASPRETHLRERVRDAVYASASALISLIGLTGLLTSYFLGSSPAGYVIAGGAPVLKGSLLGIFLEVFRGSAGLPTVKTGGLAGYLPGFLYFQIPFLGAMLLVSFSMTIAAMLRRGAGRLCRQNGVLLALPYLFLFGGNFLYRALTESSIDASFFDLAALLPAGGILLLLFLLSALERRGRGLLNCVLFLLSAVSPLALAVPGSLLCYELNGVLGELNAIRVVMLLLCGMTAGNLLVSLFRLSAGRGALLDAFRFGGQFVCAAALLFACLMGGVSAQTLFFGEPLAATVLLVCPLCAAAFSAAAAGARSAHKLKRTEPAPSPQTEPLAQPLQPLQTEFPVMQPEMQQGFPGVQQEMQPLQPEFPVMQPEMQQEFPGVQQEMQPLQPEFPVMQSEMQQEFPIVQSEMQPLQQEFPVMQTEMQPAQAAFSSGQGQLSEEPEASRAAVPLTEAMRDETQARSA